jgi:hypothetical protein
MQTRFFLISLILTLSPSCEALAMPLSTGFNEDTTILGGDGDFCAGAVLQQNDDGIFENAYAWGSSGVQPPDYGAWAECYDAEFVCGVEFAFTTIGYGAGQTMDVYVWEDDGAPPPDNNPGAVICVISGVDPGEVGFWPTFSLHDVRVCCDTGGDHFVGFWGDWPGNPSPPWFIGADEEGSGHGCPRTKFAPGIGYPTGWGDAGEAPTFAGAEAIGIREFAGVGDCEPTPAQRSTWGRIKALY